MNMDLNNYQISFEHGGVQVRKDGRLLYFNARPVYVAVKTYGAINVFRDAADDAGKDGDD